MISPLDKILAARLLGIGINLQRYQASTPLACGLWSWEPKPLNLGSFKHNPNKPKQIFQTRFSKCLATVSRLLEPWLLNPVTWQLQTSTTSLVISPTLYGKVLVAELNALSAEQWQQC